MRVDVRVFTETLTFRHLAIFLHLFVW